MSSDDLAGSVAQQSAVTLSETSEVQEMDTGSVVSELSEVQEMDTSEIMPNVQTEVSVGGHPGRHCKNKAPVSVRSVHRSARSNKYDGFKVHSITDSKQKASKVKPRVTPSAVVITELTEDQIEVEELPPPMTVAQIQEIAVQKCVVPPEEVTEEMLLADKGAGPSSF